MQQIDRINKTTFKLLHICQSNIQNFKSTNNITSNLFIRRYKHHYVDKKDNRSIYFLSKYDPNEPVNYYLNFDFKQKKKNFYFYRNLIKY